MQKPRPVLIEWEDSRQPTGVWERLSDYSPANACICFSVGFLVHDAPDVKALAPNIADVGNADDMQASGIIHIPTRCIRRVVALGERSR